MKTIFGLIPMTLSAGTANEPRATRSTRVSERERYADGMANLDGEVVLITGAAQGLGAEIAQQASAAGALVVVTDVLDEQGRATAESLEGPSIYCHLDVTDEAQWAAAITTTISQFDKLSGVVNNAGVLLMAPIETTTVAQAAAVLNVNVIGTFLGIRCATEPMRANGGGTIVNIASIDGVAAMNSVGVYGASKFAVRGLTKAAAIELGRDNIRVNAVCPAMGNPMMVQPFLDQIDVERYLEGTPKPILPRPTDASDAARMRIFLLSTDSRGCTGADFLVDGGWLAGHYCPGLPGF